MEPYRAMHPRPPISRPQSDVLTPGGGTSQPSEPTGSMSLPLYRIMPDNSVDPRLIPVMMSKIMRPDPQRNAMVWFGRMFTRES